MRLWIALLALVPACGFGSGNQNGDDGGGGGIDARQCFGSFVEICFNAAADIPAAPPTLPDGALVEVDTDASPLCDQHNKQAATYCVIAGRDFTLPAGKTIRAYGTKPLVLLSTTSFTLLGNVDVSSNRTVGAKGQGAGADPLTLCTGATPAEGGGGGFGGSFGGKGGNGERVDAIAGGVAAEAANPPGTLRGGCPGGNGSLPPTNLGGARGSGGGAVAVIATAALQLGGQINASGAGGVGGAVDKAGGGGGGSGGMIALEAAAITGSGALFANGGSGGQGGPLGASGSESTGPTAAAQGGENMNPSTTGGQGGDGAADPRADGDPGNRPQNLGGGGAGGGGVGIIRAHGVTMNISPPSSV